MNRRAAALLACLLAGCVTEQERDRRAPAILSERRWLSDWDRVVSEVQGGETPPAPLTLIHEGEHLGVYLLGLRAQERYAPPPGEEPRAEVVIVVEGGGNVVVEGRPEAVAPGDVLVLPAGARGLARGSPQLPLLCLVVRAKAPPPPDAPPARARILREQEVFPDAVLHGLAAIDRRELASLPGQLSLDALCLRLGKLPRHAHYRHDELVFVIQGFGTFGWGDEAGSAQIARGFTSSPLPTKSLVYIPTRVPHSYLDEATPTLALSVFGPAFEDGQERDFYGVPDYEKKPDAKPIEVATPKDGIETTTPTRYTPTRKVVIEDE